MIKKLISTVLAIAVLFGLTANAKTPTDVENTQYQRAVELISALKLMTESEDGLFHPDNEIKRGEFAQIVIKILGMSELMTDAANGAKFSDVSEDNPEFGYVGMVYSLGLMNGYSDGSFGIDDAITIEQAVKIVVSVLGYDIQANNKGGYPYGYMAVAAEKGILKGMDIENGAALKRGPGALLIYNALDVEMMDSSAFGNTITYSITKGKTLLSERLKVTKGKGQITGNYNTRLFNDKGIVGRDEVEIDTVPYKIGETGAYALLGYKVEYYYTEDSGIKTLVAVFPQNGMDAEITIAAEDIIERTSDGLEYCRDSEGDHGKLENAKISPAVDVIFNGVAMLNANEDTYKINSGNIKLLDVENDGTYDVVFINTFFNYIVSSVSLTDCKVFDKFGQPELTLDPSDSNITYSMVKDGANIEVGDLNENDVLSVAADKVKTQTVNGISRQVVDTDKATYYKIMVVSNTVEGKISEISEDKVTINDVQYKIAENYIKARDTTPTKARLLTLNAEGTFYLDAEGKIAYTELKQNSCNNYGYLLQVNKLDGVAGLTEFKILNSDGSITVYSAVDNVKFNGYVIKESEIITKSAIYNNGTIRQLVNFSLNDAGLITELNTAVDHTTDITNPLSPNYNYRGYDEDAFSKDFALSSCTFRNGNIFNNRYILDSSTIVFLIPPAKINGIDAKDEDYKIADVSWFCNDNSYDIAIYDATKDNIATVVVVNCSYTKPTTSVRINSSSCALIDKVVNSVDENGENVTKLYFIKDGKMDSVTAKSNTINAEWLAVPTPGADPQPSPSPGTWGIRVKNVSELKQGDIIQYSVDDQGRMDYFRVLFTAHPLPLRSPRGFMQKCNATGVNGGNATSPSSYGTVYDMNDSASIYAAYGIIMEVNSSNALFNATTPPASVLLPDGLPLLDATDTNVLLKNLSNAYNRTLVFSGAKVYRYDSKLGRVSIGSTGDLQPGQFVFVHKYGEKVKEFVIID